MALLRIPQPDKIGIDLGTSRTRIWVGGRGVVLDEPTVLAIDNSTQKVIAVGSDAQEMLGRVQAPIQVIFPVVDGVATDAEFLSLLIKIFLQRIIRSSYFFRPHIMVATSSAVLPAEKAALVDILYQIGGGEVYTIHTALAAAIGAGVPIADASGTGLFLVGEGVAEAAVVSLSSVVATRASLQAGTYLRSQLQYQLRSEYSLEVANESLTQLLKTASFDVQKKWKLELTGRNTVNHTPAQLVVTTEHVGVILERVLTHWHTLINETISQVPPALTADILDKGLLLAGGIPQMAGLEERLAQLLGLPVSTVERPDLVVITGIGVALDNIDLFKQSIAYSQ